MVPVIYLTEKEKKDKKKEASLSSNLNPWLNKVVFR